MDVRHEKAGNPFRRLITFGLAFLFSVQPFAAVFAQIASTTEEASSPGSGFVSEPEVDKTETSTSVSEEISEDEVATLPPEGTILDEEGVASTTPEARQVEGSVLGESAEESDYATSTYPEKEKPSSDIALRLKEIKEKAVLASKISDEDAYAFVVEETKKQMGESYTPQAIKRNQKFSEEQIEEYFSETGGGMQMLMSESGDSFDHYLHQIPRTAGLSRTNDTSGAFVYSVPLTIPPGRNGLQPSLELRYTNQTSQDVNVMGYGWDTSIPYIERINRKGSQYLYSTTSDTFFYSSLTGELATTSTSGLFFSKVDDGSYTKYFFSTSSNQWVVTSKDGKIYKFGYSTSTRQDNPDYSDRVYKWMLEEVRDPNGNYIKYEYYKDSGHIYPSLITYTGNGATDGIFTVNFNRETRPDYATSSAQGFVATSKHRLDEITVSINGNWVKKYEIDYTTGDNDRRSLISAITESGRTEDASSALTLPPTNFTYKDSLPGWATTTTLFSLPVSLRQSTSPRDIGVRIADVNGDALPDIIRAQEGATKEIHINNGTGWDLDNNWNFPEYFVDEDGIDLGTRLFDVNGDGLIDIVRREINGSNEAYLHNGSGWATTSLWHSPLAFTGEHGSTAARLGDVNGDGLIDIFTSSYYPQYGFNSSAIYVNNGITGWEITAESMPIYFMNWWLIDGESDGQVLGAIAEDVNNDGFVDLISKDTNQLGGQGVFINIGSTTPEWIKEDSWIIPGELSGGTTFVDVNGDRLVDYVEGSSDQQSNIYLNDGSNWVPDTSWTAPIVLGTVDGRASHFVDVDGDGMIDLVQRNESVHNRFLNQGEPRDVLTYIEENKGGRIGITYQSSARYTDGSGNELNGKLPFTMQTAKSITHNDGFSSSTVSYEYKDGRYYFSNPFDRLSAGFGVVSKTDPEDNVTKTYYHQGNTSSTTLGEYDDRRSKIGKIYRTEVYNDNDNLYSLLINKWDHHNRVGDADFVKLTRSIALTYDGDSDHKDTAEEFSYDNATGTLSEKIQWGRVVADTDGSFTDTGSDKRVTAFTYAASTTGYLVLPSQETVTDQGGSKIRESKYYFDALSQGSVTKGNTTKVEQWKTSSTYINSQTWYNNYGLATSTIDPRGKMTTYTYDAYNLYPSTTTNPLSHVTGKLFDYSSGKTTYITDPNGRNFQTILDALDRVEEEKQPDLTTPTTLATKTEYQYTDTGMPRKVQTTNYLSSATSTDVHTYFDGFGRKVEERIEAEGTNTFTVKDYYYDERGLLESESLPFFASSTSYTGVSSPPVNSLLIEYTYDPMQRVKTVENVLGTVTNTYDDWKTITTDLLGNTKEFSKDAYDNLETVVENNGGSDYTTTYAYNGNNLLTQITDAENNVRDFTYDGLGRRLTAEDLHAPLDLSFGTWTYTYDDTGNMTQTIDPKSQTVNYTYDDLNRVLTEDYTGGTGTEISYGYDGCTEGAGRLCHATSTSNTVTSYEYNALGGVKKETKKVTDTTYVTRYEHDRLGNQTLITYPDGSQTQYLFNSAGLVEVAQYRDSEASPFTNIILAADYSPAGKVSRKLFGNGVQSSYTFDSNQLYRLTNIFTD